MRSDQSSVSRSEIVIEFEVVAVGRDPKVPTHPFPQRFYADARLAGATCFASKPNQRRVNCRVRLVKLSEPGIDRFVEQRRGFHGSLANRLQRALTRGDYQARRTDRYPRRALRDDLGYVAAKVARVFVELREVGIPGRRSSGCDDRIDCL